MSTQDPSDPYGKPPPDPYGGNPEGGGQQPPYGGQPQYGSPYDQAAAAGQPPYGQSPAGQSPAGQSPYGQSPYDAALAGMPPLGGLGHRLLARIIDGVIVYGVLSAVFLPILDLGSTPQMLLFGLGGTLVYWAYDSLMVAARGQTLGKQAMKVRVAALADGATPATGAAWTRGAVYSLPGLLASCGTIFWLVNVLWCTWDKPYRQCLHDKAAKTVVVSTAV